MLTCWIFTDISKESNVLFRAKLSKYCLESILCKRYWQSTSPHDVTSSKTVFSMAPLWESPVSHSTHCVLAGEQNLDTPFLLFWRFPYSDPPFHSSVWNSVLEMTWILLTLFSMTCYKSIIVRGNLSLTKAGLRLQHCVLLFGPNRSRFIPFDISVSSLTS